MNSSQGVYMDTDAVRGMAKNFENICEVLRTVSKVLEALSLLLKTTAFVGLVGGAIARMYIDTFKPRVDDLADNCEELGKDLNASVLAYERGDALGATRFY